MKNSVSVTRRDGCLEREDNDFMITTGVSQMDLHIPKLF